MQQNLADNFILLLLMLAALIAAWVLGSRSQSRKRSAGGQNLSKDYFIGLNYLLNDEPDDAIDTFINALEINSTTLETHMALGTLLRRRGKVDKSIVVYQGMLARPRLDVNDVNRVKVELVRSYIAAGLLDRAERLLDELQGAGSEIKHQALSLGVNLYQLEKDWEQAVVLASEFLRICPTREKARYQSMASHFHCELAQLDIAQRQYQTARQQLKKAGQFNRNNVRVSLLLGQVEMEQENYREAAKSLLRVSQQDMDFESETFAPLLECYEQLGSEKQLRKFIQNQLEDEPPVSVILGISVYIQNQSDSSAALNFLLEHLRRKPSLRVVNRALAILSREGDSDDQKHLMLFHNIIEEYLSGRPMYQCRSCGFEAKNLHWLCPSCSEWGMIKPIRGILGE